MNSINILISFSNWRKIEKDNKIIWQNKKTKMIQYVKPTSTIFVLEAAFINNIAFIEFYLKFSGDINVLDKENRNGKYIII